MYLASKLSFDASYDLCYEIRKIIPHPHVIFKTSDAKL